MSAVVSWADAISIDEIDSKEKLVQIPQL